MKIVVAGMRGFPDIQGGIESHCEHLYPHLTRLGCSVTVFTRKPYVARENKEYRGVRLISLDCPRNKFLETIIHTFKSISLAKKMSPDILHIHAIGPSLFAPYARVLGMKVVITHHGSDYMRKKWSASAKIFLRFCEMLGVIFANNIIVIAGNISNDIKKKYNKDTAIIPNGVDIPKLAETEDFLEKYKLCKKKYILTVGRFVPEKGFHDLINAFNKCDFNNVKLVIVGDADHEDGYSRALKEKAGENSNIILTGFLKGQPLHELFSHAGLFVLPSYYEGLPIVLLEAMSYGLSCIASDIPANRNVTLGEDRFFQPGDITLLAARLEHFLSLEWTDKDRNKQIEMTASKYSWEKIANETLEVYRRVLSA